MTVKVEEARTITGNTKYTDSRMLFSLIGIPWLPCSATAWIFADIFDEYVYNMENSPDDNIMRSTQDQEIENSSFEMPLNTVLDCLNIFGTAVSSSGVGGKKGWKKQSEDSDHESGDENGRWIEPLNPNTSEKHTGMRLTYMGSGYPLTLLMYMYFFWCCQSYLHLFSAEDAVGPTTTCEISTYEPEPYLDFGFDSDRLCVYIKQASIWSHIAYAEFLELSWR